METIKEIKLFYSHVAHDIYRTITNNCDGTFTGTFSDFGKEVKETFRMETKWANFPDFWNVFDEYGFDLYETNSDKLIATRQDGVRMENFTRGSIVGNQWKPARFQFEITNDNGTRKFENVPESEEQLEAILKIMGIKKV